jgi:hypothetical protein
MILVPRTLQGAKRPVRSTCPSGCCQGMAPMATRPPTQADFASSYACKGSNQGLPIQGMMHVAGNIVLGTRMHCHAYVAGAAEVWIVPK